MQEPVTVLDAKSAEQGLLSRLAPMLYMFRQSQLDALAKLFEEERSYQFQNEFFQKLGKHNE